MSSTAIAVLVVLIAILLMYSNDIELFSSLSEGVAPEEAMKLLKDGNQRFIDGKTIHPHSDIQRVKDTAAKQTPFAAVLGCADSRVPAEILFDQGVGDIFDVRVAGNIATFDAIGSLEYAIEHLGVRLIVVMGHTNCGAVKATVEANLRDLQTDQAGFVDDIMRYIAPIVPKAQKMSLINKSNVVTEAVKLNVKNTIQQMLRESSAISQAVYKHEIKIVPAMYDVNTGQVIWLS